MINLIGSCNNQMLSIDSTDKSLITSMILIDSNVKSNWKVHVVDKDSNTYKFEYIGTDLEENGYFLSVDSDSHSVLITSDSESENNIFTVYLESETGYIGLRSNNYEFIDGSCEDNENSVSLHPDASDTHRSSLWQISA